MLEELPSDGTDKFPTIVTVCSMSSWCRGVNTLSRLHCDDGLLQATATATVMWRCYHNLRVLPTDARMCVYKETFGPPAKQQWFDNTFFFLHIYVQQLLMISRYDKFINFGIDAVDLLAGRGGREGVGREKGIYLY